MIENTARMNGYGPVFYAKMGPAAIRAVERSNGMRWR
jgi:hypothetical protein